MRSSTPARHAPMSSSATARTSLELEILDDGAGETTVAGSGLGLDGMRERVEIYGGALESWAAGGLDFRGYALRATLPLGPSR